MSGLLPLLPGCNLLYTDHLVFWSPNAVKYTRPLFFFLNLPPCSISLHQFTKNPISRTDFQARVDWLVTALTRLWRSTVGHSLVAYVQTYIFESVCHDASLHATITLWACGLVVITDFRLRKLQHLLQQTCTLFLILNFMIFLSYASTLVGYQLTFLFALVIFDLAFQLYRVFKPSK